MRKNFTNLFCRSTSKTLEGKFVVIELQEKKQILMESKDEHEEFTQTGGMDSDLKKLKYYTSLAKTKEIDAIPFDFTTFVLLQRYFIRNGSFLTAYYIAKNMILSIPSEILYHGNFYDPQKREHETSIHSIPEKYYIWKEIFAGNIEGALENCERLITKLNNPRNIDKVKMFEYAFLGGNFYKTTAYNSEENFKSMIQGKNAVMLGPAPDDEIDIEKICRQNDVIILFNYKRNENIDKYKNYNPNLKVISYYSQDGFEEFSDCIMDYISDLDGCTIRENYSETALNIAASKKARYMSSYYEILYYGTLQLMQIAMLDLLQFNPKNLSVFGCNLFLGKSLYVKGYSNILDSGREHESDQMKKLLECFAFHNMALQFWVVKTLYVNGLIIPSRILKNILDKNTVESYLKNMEKIYQ